MPKIDPATVKEHHGSRYPAPYDAPCAGRHWKRLGHAAGLTAYGANLVRLDPGAWASQRHWHERLDEFLVVLSGELVLVEDGGETVMRAGDCAAFPKNSGNGHHMVNRSDAEAVFLVVGDNHPQERCHYPDADLMFVEDGRGGHYTNRAGERY
jgi:uncharacterized cupin superfamily protein